MIVVMKPDATQEHIDGVAQRVREMGLKDHVINGTDLAVVAVLGDDRKMDGTVLEQAPGAPWWCGLRGGGGRLGLLGLEGVRGGIWGSEIALRGNPESLKSVSEQISTAMTKIIQGAGAAHTARFQPIAASCCY